MKKGYVFIFLTALLYSTQEIANKMLMKNHLDGFQITFIIFLMGAIILTPLAIKDLKQRQFKITGSDCGYFAINAALCIPIAMALLSFACKYTQASTSAVIFSSNAVFTVPFAYLILKEKVDKMTLISLVVSIIGVVIIFNPSKMMAGSKGGTDLLGITLALGAAIAWSLFTVISKMKIEKYGGYIFNCFVFYFGAIMVLIILLVTGRPIFSGIEKESILVLLYMGIFIKALGYIFYLGAIKMTSAVTASMVFLIKPALATVLAVAILGEKITASMLIGIGLIIVGSYINFSSKKSQQATQQVVE
ncbi:DMT family transporter [Clostridium brassicae]|uniref:EamA family transporter n=1 Tax=Clostridium brassicae TaxID=2999072 RepID=A0ABT4DEC1_9CLOT|nr:EamA family transporter [Clostridium brassicae]MCY6960660.1 EamA family transporter [Clostridium brassicae]